MTPVTHGPEKKTFFIAEPVPQSPHATETEMQPTVRFEENAPEEIMYEAPETYQMPDLIPQPMSNFGRAGPYTKFLKQPTPQPTY